MGGPPSDLVLKFMNKTKKNKILILNNFKITLVQDVDGLYLFRFEVI